MTAPAQRSWLVLAAIFAIVLLSRVPFLDAGYGRHADAWRVARTAKTLAATGDYQPSRPPGFPLHEWLAAGVWKWRAPGLNALSAVASATACVLLALYARRVGVRDWALTGLALAGLPAFYVNSVSAKDFALTLALLLSAYLVARSGRAAWAGVVFGLVVSSRPVAVIHGLPLAIVLLSALPKERRVRAFVAFCALGAIVIAAFYAPIFAKFGPENLREPYRLADLRASLVLHRGTIDVWGALGLIGLGLIAIGACFARKLAAAVVVKAPPAEQCAWLISAAMGIGFYVWLPDQAGYCIPALPFVLLLAAQWTSRLALQLGAVLMLGAAFLGQDFRSPGAIVIDHRERLAELDKVRGFTAFCSTLKPGVVVCGSWEPIISVLDLASGGQRYSFLLAPAEIAQLMKQHAPIYYTPEMRAFEYRVHQIDLAAIGGVDARALYLKAREQR